MNPLFPASLVPLSLHITPTLLRDYAELTHDFNPIHLDADFAATTPMQRVIAHGTLSLGLLWQSLAGSVPPGMQFDTADVRFVRPVRLGDTVTAGGEAVADGVYKVWVIREGGEAVVEGRAECRHPPLPTH